MVRIIFVIEEEASSNSASLLGASLGRFEEGLRPLDLVSLFHFLLRNLAGLPNLVVQVTPVMPITALVPVGALIAGTLACCRAPLNDTFTCEPPAVVGKAVFGIIHTFKPDHGFVVLAVLEALEGMIIFSKFLLIIINSLFIAMVVAMLVDMLAVAIVVAMLVAVLVVLLEVLFLVLLMVALGWARIARISRIAMVLSGTVGWLPVHAVVATVAMTVVAATSSATVAAASTLHAAASAVASAAVLKGISEYIFPLDGEHLYGPVDTGSVVEILYYLNNLHNLRVTSTMVISTI
jgi:hypothetical protein